MITIPVAVQNGVNVPSEPFPDDAISIVCDGVTYTVYQTGDELPLPNPT